MDDFSLAAVNTTILFKQILISTLDAARRSHNHFCASLTQSIQPNRCYTELKAIMNNTMTTTLPRFPPPSTEHPIFFTSMQSLGESDPHRENSTLTNEPKKAVAKTISSAAPRDTNSELMVADLSAEARKRQAAFRTSLVSPYVSRSIR